MSYIPADACCQRCGDRPCSCINHGATQDDQGWWSGGTMKFKGQPIKVREGATGRRGRFEFLYGGIGAPDGPGHGHVVCNDGETINYWKEPFATDPIIDDKYSSEQLRFHLF